MVPPAVQVAAVSLCFTQLWVWAGGVLVFCGVAVGCGVAVLCGVAVGAAVFLGVAVARGVALGRGVAVAVVELLCELLSGVAVAATEEEDPGTAPEMPVLPDGAGLDAGRPPVPSRPNLTAATTPSTPTSTTPAALSATASPWPERYFWKKPSLPWRPPRGGWPE